jgi:hypothetical protein
MEVIMKQLVHLMVICTFLVTVSMDGMHSLKQMMQPFLRPAAPTSARTVNTARTGRSVHRSRPMHYYAKDNGKSLTEEEHKAAYQAELNNQFPSAPLYNKNYDPTKNETVEIQKDLDQKAPGVKASWIPTAWYEWFYIKNRDNRFVDDKLLNDQDWLMHSYLNDFETEQSFSTANQNEKLVAEHKCFNEVISGYVEKQQPQKENETEKNYLKRIYLTDKTDEIVSNACNWEINNKETFLYPMYRGGGGGLPEFRDDQVSQVASNNKNALSEALKNTSASYGNSLYAGFYCERLGCTRKYIDRSQEGYILPINKTNHDHWKRLFFLSPLSILGGMYGVGQLFHNRSKLFWDEEWNNGWRLVSGIRRIDKKVPEYLIHHCDEQTAKEKILERQRYIIKNAIPLTSDTATTLEHARKILNMHAKFCLVPKNN